LIQFLYLPCPVESQNADRAQETLNRENARQSTSDTMGSTYSESTTLSLSTAAHGITPPSTSASTSRLPNVVVFDARTRTCQPLVRRNGKGFMVGFTGARHAVGRLNRPRSHPKYITSERTHSQDRSSPKVAARSPTKKFQTPETTNCFMN
jgi:hypothetical protein